MQSPPASAFQPPRPFALFWLRYEDFTLGDVEAMRLLRGGSVIDWHRLAFTDAAEVDRFLRINEFDPAVPTTWSASRSCAPTPSST